MRSVGTSSVESEATTAPTVVGLARGRGLVDARELWSIEDVASFLGVTRHTIYTWRTTGYGPTGFRVGKHLRWRAGTVIEWTETRERAETTL